MLCSQTALLYDYEVFLKNSIQKNDKYIDIWKQFFDHAWPPPLRLYWKENLLFSFIKNIGRWIPNILQNWKGEKNFREEMQDIKVTVMSSVINLLTCKSNLTPPKYQKKFCTPNYNKSCNHEIEMCPFTCQLFEQAISYLASQTVTSASRWKLL